MATSVADRPLPYSPQLDGLRAIAVAAVAWTHWAPMRQFGLPFGSGVHLFYVISGYLITSLLLHARAQHDHAAALRTFYARRVLRIFPAFYTVLALAALFDVRTVRETWLWHATYLSNVQLYYAQFMSPVSHFWSLAVEEQFYLVWPWIIVFLPRRLLVPVCAAGIVAAPLARLLLRGFGMSELPLVLPLGSFDALGIGALIALIEHGYAPETWRRDRVIGAIAAVGLPLYVASIAWNVSGRELPLLPWALFQFVQALTFGAIVGTAVPGFRGWLGRVLASRPMIGVGRISYGIYLVHVFAPPVVRAILRAFGVDSLSLRGWEIQPLYVITTLAFAGALWIAIERPMNSLKRYFPVTAARMPAHLVPTTPL